MLREGPYLEDLIHFLQTWVPIEEDRAHFQNESGLYDPQTMSLVKLRRNGAIDMFVGTNEGIRIDPNTHRISVLQEELAARLTTLDLLAQGKVSARAIQDMLLSAGGNITLEAKGTIRLKADRIVLDSRLLEGALRELPPHSHHDD